MYSNDPKPKSGGRHQLENAHGETTFCRIVHGVHDVPDVGGRQCRVHDADAGLSQESCRACKKIGINPSVKPVRSLARKDRGTLDGHTTRQEDLVADGNASLPHESSRSNLAKHLTHENRAVEAWGDFGVAAADRDAQLVASRAHVGHDALGQLGRGAPLWKQHDDEEP